MMWDILRHIWGSIALFFNMMVISLSDSAVLVCLVFGLLILAATLIARSIIATRRRIAALENDNPIEG